jgi:hypothetical protein
MTEFEKPITGLTWEVDFAMPVRDDICAEEIFPYRPQVVVTGPGR